MRRRASSANRWPGRDRRKAVAPKCLTHVAPATRTSRSNALCGSTVRGSSARSRIPASRVVRSRLARSSAVNSVQHPCRARPCLPDHLQGRQAVGVDLQAPGLAGRQPPHQLEHRRGSPLGQLRAADPPPEPPRPHIGRNLVRRRTGPNPREARTTDRHEGGGDGEEGGRRDESGAKSWRPCLTRLFGRRRNNPCCGPRQDDRAAAAGDGDMAVTSHGHGSCSWPVRTQARRLNSSWVAFRTPTTSRCSRATGAT